MSRVPSRGPIALLVGLLASLLVAACATPGGSPSPSPGASAIAHPTAADALVLRIDTSGGFVAPGALVSHIPEISLYGDGRLVTPGPMEAIYPSPLLPTLQAERLSEGGIQRILARARAAGLLGPDRQLTGGPVADAPTTVFTVFADGGRHAVSVYALGLEVQGFDDTVARAALQDFRTAMQDLQPWLGADVLEGPVALGVDRLQVVVSGAVFDPSLPQAPRAWPLASPLAAFGHPLANEPALHCAVVAGPELPVFLAAVRSANALTPWQSGGRAWGLIVRPLLPDEPGCTDGS